MSREGARNWYIFDGGRVSGPFNPAEIHKQITEGLNADSLVWDGVSPNWISILAWNLEHLGQFTPSFDAWYFSVDGLQQGSFTLKELSDKILNKEVPLHARFWTTGLIKWVTLSELPQVVEGAGLLRRKVPRAPFVGDIEIKGMAADHALAVTLSEGGIGLLNLLQLGVGAKISLNIVSQLFSENIETRATILHQNGNISSLKFEGLSEKSKHCILNYISEFTSST